MLPTLVLPPSSHVTSRGKTKLILSLSFPREGTGFGQWFSKCGPQNGQLPLGAHQKHKLSGLRTQTGGSRTLRWGPAICVFTNLPGALRCPGERSYPTGGTGTRSISTAQGRGRLNRGLHVTRSPGAPVQINICKVQSQSWVTPHPVQL